METSFFCKSLCYTIDELIFLSAYSIFFVNYPSHSGYLCKNLGIFVFDLNRRFDEVSSNLSCKWDHSDPFLTVSHMWLL